MALVTLHCDGCDSDRPIVAECEYCGLLYCDECADSGCVSCEDDEQDEADRIEAETTHTPENEG